MCPLHTLVPYSIFFSFNHPATTEIYTLSLHDALPILARRPAEAAVGVDRELLGRADGEDPADTLRDVLRCVLGEALHVHHTRAELAPIAVSLPEVELGHLAARELQHELVGP